MNFNNGIVSNPFAAYNSWGNNKANRNLLVTPQNDINKGYYSNETVAQNTIKQVFKNCTGCQGAANVQPKKDCGCSGKKQIVQPKKDCGCGCGGKKKWAYNFDAKHILIAALLVAGLMIILSSSPDKKD